MDGDAEGVLLEFGEVQASYSDIRVFLQDVADFALVGIDAGVFDGDYFENIKHSNVTGPGVFTTQILDVIRSRRHADMLEAATKYYRVLNGILKLERGQIRLLPERERLAELKEKLDLLSEPFSGDPAFISFLRMKRAAALGDET